MNRRERGLIIGWVTRPSEKPTRSEVERWKIEKFEKYPQSLEKWETLAPSKSLTFDQ